MTRFALLLTSLLLIFSLSAQAELQPGDHAPSFTAQASLNGQAHFFSLEKALQKGPAVVYFFPSAFTYGCDLEAHTFSTQAAAFKQAGATIIGVSGDSLARLHAFSKDPDFCAGKFPVASDADGSIATRYNIAIQHASKGMTDVRGDAVDHLLFARTTFVIGQDGTILASFSSKNDNLTPVDHVMKSLAKVQSLQQPATSAE